MLSGGSIQIDKEVNSLLILKRLFSQRSAKQSRTQHHKAERATQVIHKCSCNCNATETGDKVKDGVRSQVKFNALFDGNLSSSFDSVFIYYLSSTSKPKSNGSINDLLPWSISNKGIVVVVGGLICIWSVVTYLIRLLAPNTDRGRQTSCDMVEYKLKGSGMEIRWLRH